MLPEAVAVLAPRSAVRRNSAIDMNKEINKIRVVVDVRFMSFIRCIFTGFLNLFS